MTLLFRLFSSSSTQFILSRLTTVLSIFSSIAINPRLFLNARDQVLQNESENIALLVYFHKQETSRKKGF
jgi:hypothetical protein